MPTLPYDLRCGDPDAGACCVTLARFADSVLARVEDRAGGLIDEYARFVADHALEPPRSRGEYAVEILTLGMVWKRYAGGAQRTAAISTDLLGWLLRLRTRNARLKPAVDRMRGVLAGAWLVPRIGCPDDDVPRTLTSLTRLVAWLAASGEFKDEVKRLRVWLQFCAAAGPTRVTAVCDAACALIDWFGPAAHAELGRYTAELGRFLREDAPRHRWLEDGIFCGKQPVEYHLNMVASDLMNRGLRAEFLATPCRVVLLPGCMRPDNGVSCRAEIRGRDIRCRRCSADCAVARITRIGQVHDFETRIVPHSSSFTSWLQRWQESREHGVVAVACLLNIAPGGYEMRELQIPSQCVLLDWCGCKRHWHPAGVPTDLSDQRLLAVVRPQPADGVVAARCAARPSI